MTGDVEARDLASEAAHEIARSGVCQDLAARVARVFGTDAGTAFGEYSFVAGGRSRITVAEGDPLSDAEVEARRRSAPGHPGWGLLGRPDVPRTVRLSDVVSLPRFWGTEPYRIFHAPEGGRYPANALLVADRREVVFLALQRRTRDFTQAEMDRLAVVQRLLAAAFVFRAALEQAAADTHSDLAGTLTRDEPAEHEPGLTQDYRPTRREAEVLALAARGWTNHRIAGALGVSERTVRKHLSAVYDKSMTYSRAAATAWWERRRLV